MSFLDLSDTSQSIDTRTYFLIENPNRTLQIVLMTGTNCFSTVVNFLGFYLILIESKRELKIYRLVLFTHNLSLYLAQFYLGSIVNAAMLFPFPGFYSIGPLASLVDSFSLMLIWLVIFGFSVVMMYVIVLFRLKSMTKPGDMFHFGYPAYTVFTVILCAYIYIPVIYFWCAGLDTKEKTRQFVAVFYPNCLNVFNFPGVFVYSNPKMFEIMSFGAVFLLASGAALYLTICFIIVYQIQRYCQVWSQRQLNYHRKVLKDTVIQNVLRGTCLLFAPIAEIAMNHLDPATDLKTIAIIANVSFSAAPIPCTIAMFFQNPHYRKFLFSRFMRMFKLSGGNSEVERERDRTTVVGPARRISKGGIHIAPNYG